MLKRPTRDFLEDLRQEELNTQHSATALTTQVGQNYKALYCVRITTKNEDLKMMRYLWIMKSWLWHNLDVLQMEGAYFTIMP